MKNQKVQSARIMDSIINHGGLIGKCAALYKDNPQLSDRFIKEFAQQTYTNMARMWGHQLAEEILKYALKYERNEIA